MTSFVRPITRSLYVAILKSDEASPFLPVSDEEKTKEEKDEEKENRKNQDEEKSDSGDSKKDAEESSKKSSDDGDGNDKPAKDVDKNEAGENDDKDKSKGDEKKKDDVQVEIDFDKIAYRIVDAPGLPARNYAGLTTGPEGKVYVLESIENQPGATLHQYSLKEKKAEKFADKISEITTSHDRKKILLKTPSGWNSADAGSKPKDGGKGLNISGMRVKINPRAGGDPQLERAVAEALELLKMKKIELKPEPTPPVRALRPGDK